MQADHQQRLAPPEIDGSSAISIPSSAIHQQGRLFASGAAWVGGGTVGNHAISGTTSPNNDGGDNSSGSNVLWINGSGGSPGMYGTTGNGGIPRHTGTSAPLLPLPQLPGSFMSGAGTGTLALDSIQPVASRSRHGHDPSARVRVGVEDMGRKEMKDPRRARATQRGRGAEDPRGGRRDWEEHKQGNTLLGSRVEAQAPGQDTAVQGSQGDTERGVSGSGQGGAREEGIIDETDWRPRGRNSTSGVRQDQQPRKWQPYPGRGRGFRRGDRGRGRTQGNRGRGRGNDDSVGGSGSHVGEHFRDKHKSEVIERRSLAQSASSKIESHDTDRNNGRRQASERERTSSLAPRGRKAVREDFTDDRERSRSPSVGQDRGPTVAPAPISPSTGTLPSASTCVSQPSPAPTTARELFPESSHPRQLNYAMAIASNHPPPSSAVPQPLSHPHSLDAVQPTIYPSPIKKKGITLPVAPLPPIRTSLQQLGAPLPAAVPTSPSPTPPKQATSPPREIVVIPDSAATSRTVASTSKPAASLTITPRTASTIMGELDSSICADQAGGGLKRPGRVVNKEPVPLRSMKRVRVSEAKPASQAAPIFSSDDETPEQSVKITANNELRGEWPHEFKFLLEAKDRVCSVCEKDFVRICTACSKCVECVRNGNKECVVGASQERRHSPPPQGSAVQRDWPEYPKTVTRNSDGTAVLEKRMERAIFEAIRTGDTNSMVGLLRAGVSPNFKRPTGESCLHAAAYCGAVDLVKYLQNHKADPTVKDSHGNLAVDLAAMQGKDEVVAILQPLAPSTRIHTIAAHQRHRQHVHQQKQHKERQHQQYKKEEGHLTLASSQSLPVHAPQQTLRTPQPLPPPTSASPSPTPFTWP